jgi:hypothetical protein
MSIYQVNAVTSCTGSRLSRTEQVLGLDRHDLRTDGKLVNHSTIGSVDSFKSVSLGQILSGDQYLKFDLLARRVLEEEGHTMKTRVQVGSKGKLQEMRTPLGRFRQHGTSYYGNVEE